MTAPHGAYHEYSSLDCSNPARAALFIHGWDEAHHADRRNDTADPHARFVSPFHRRLRSTWRPRLGSALAARHSSRADTPGCRRTRHHYDRRHSDHDRDRANRHFARAIDGWNSLLVRGLRPLATCAAARAQLTEVHYGKIRAPKSFPGLE